MKRNNLALLLRAGLLLAGSAALASAQLTITNPTSLPNAVVGQAYSLQFQASGGASPYSWRFRQGATAPPNFSLSAGGLLTGTPNSNNPAGATSLGVQVTDSAGTVATQTFGLTILSTAPLSLTFTGFPQGVVGAPYSFQLAATGGAAPYTWAVQPAVVTLPSPGLIAPGVFLDSKTGLVSGTPASSGTQNFTITVIDSANGSVSQAFQLLITPAGPLGITTATVPGGTVGVKYSQQLGATGGTPPYKWSVVAGTLPAGLVFDAATGILFGTPSAAATASFTVGLADSAATPGSARQALSLTVVNPLPVTITTATLKGGFTGAPYQDQVVASGGVPPYKWSIANGTLPVGLTLDTASGVVVGRPTTAGTSSVTIQVADSGLLNATARQTYSIVIGALTSVTVPAATILTAVAGAAYSQALGATGGAPPYTWTVVAGTVPPGLALSSTGSLLGVPNAPGTFTFNAKANDTAGGSDAGYMTLSVLPASVTLQADTLPSGMVGVPYPVQVLSPGGGIGPYSLAVSSGSLPTGITLSGGRVTGTPTVAGTFNFTVTATDSNLPAGTSNLALALAVRTAQADLALSTGSVAFALTSGATVLPAAVNVVVTSTVPATSATYSVALTPAAPWLTVTGAASGTTPSSYTMSVNNQALALAASATPYQTALVFTCVTPATCLGSTQSVAVNLVVSSPPPLLLLTKQLLALTATSGQLVTGTFGLQNAGGGSITINSAVSADGWAGVSGLPATLAAAAQATGIVTVNPGGFAPGYYRTSLTISTSGGTATLPLTLLVAATATMDLNPGGQLYQMTAGGAVPNPSGSFAVTVQGPATASWNATLLPGAPWLSLKTTSGSSTAAAAGTVSYAIDPAAAAALAARAYYGTIRVTSTQTVNSPQDFLVVLNVGSATDAISVEPAPGGVAFAAVGSAAVTPQTVQVFAGSGAAVTYQAAATTANGRNWLSVSPATGTVRGGTPAQVTISVTQAGLAPGTYRGAVTVATSPASARSVNVTFIVTPSVSGVPVSSAGYASPRALIICTPSQLVLSSGFAGDFSQSVAWPVPINIQLLNDCGASVAGGNVEVVFPTAADPPLALRPDPASPGRYFGTWTPRRASSQFALGVSASAAGFPTATLQVNGKVLPNSAPVVTPQSTSNVFSGILGGVAPGTAVQIYGANLAAPGTSALASALPFPVSLGGTAVLIGGIAAPLYYVSPGQINALVPYELVSGNQYQIVVNTGNGPTVPDPIGLAAATPGIAAFASGALIAQHSDYSLVTATAPAKPGEGLVIYLAGLGATENQPVTGSGAPLPPTGPKIPVALTLNGTAIPTAFVGLTPGAVGLYQVNFQLPVDTPVGDLTLRVSQAGALSNVTILPVRK